MADIQISGFEILEKLGQGGMATVWKARQISLDRLVAIKFLHSQMASDPDDLKRFQQEAQSAAKLKHPGIVQVYDANIENGLYYFVMEFIAGYTCRDWQVRAGRLAEKDTLLIAESVVEALDYAWDRERLIHCDIKPDNIMIDDDGTVKVADLGLARTISTMSSDVSDEILGTPAYMAPEQAQGEPGLDCRTDMYSLGAMLYHLATGQLPFEGYEADEVMLRQINDVLPNPRDLNPSLSKGFCRLVEVLMAKKQDGRPLDWKQVREAIRYVRKGMMPRLQLPEGIVSTVSPSAAQDHLVSPLAAGASGGIHGSGRKNKKSQVPYIAIGLVITLMTVVFLLMHFGEEGGPTPISPTGTGGEQPLKQAEVPAVDRARQLYDRAEAWERQYPGQLDEAIRRYGSVVSEFSGSPYAERAQRAIDRLESRKQSEAIAALLASLQRDVEPLLSRRDYDAAVQMYDAYSGEWAAETMPARMARVAELKQAQADWVESERVRAEEESTRRTAALLDDVASLCVEGDFSSAFLKIEHASDGDALAGAKDELNGLYTMLKNAVQIDNAIIDSFLNQRGQQITVELVSGPQNLLINNARADTVYASTVIGIRGGTASRASNFTLKDLAVNERIKRMGADGLPHVNLAKGVMACNLGSFDHARRFFSATDERIAPRLVAHLEARQLRAGVDWMKTELGKLMGVAALTPGASFDSAGWVNIVNAADLSPTQADGLRQAATLFRDQNQGRPGYDQVSDVVAALMAVRSTKTEAAAPAPESVRLPTVALPADLAALVGNADAVLDRLLADNKSLEAESVEVRRDNEGRVTGVSIRSNGIASIRALAAFRELRSFELRSTGRHETAQLADIGPLAGLPLESVIIEGAKVEDLKSLAGLPLRTLRVPRTAVRDLSPLRGMRLEVVDLSGTRVFDFTPLSFMPVKSFAANDTQLRDLGFMRQWQLESLELSGTRVYDFSVLTRMPLKRLVAANTQLKTLDTFNNCPLEELDISGSGIQDLSPLVKNAKTLSRLKMDGLSAGSVDVFQSLNLTALSMENTKVDHLRLLSHMPLVDLSIRNTPVSTLDGLPTSQLVHLQIEGTKITSIGPLRNAGALRRFHCRNTRISDFSPIYGSRITHLFVDEPERKNAVFRRLPALGYVNWVPFVAR